MTHLQSTRLKSWTSLTFFVSLFVALIFLEGVAFGGRTIVAVSHEGATLAMLVVCFLVGAHLRLFVHSKKMFWLASVTIVSISELLAVWYLDQEDVFLICFLIVGFCAGIFLSQTKRCWFTH
jgi:hypothetical protein